MAEVAVVVVAAGRGSRAGGDLPKQFRPIGGEPMIRQSLVMLVEHPEVGPVQPVIHPDDVAKFQSSAAGLDLLPPVFGGATRQSSVRAGLEALAPRKPDIVLDPRRGPALRQRGAGVARDRGGRAKRRGHPGAAGHRHGQDGRRRRLGRQDARPQHACAWCRRRRASPSRRCSPRTAAPPKRAARISPTTPRSPNGPASRSASLPASPATSRSPSKDDFARARSHAICARLATFAPAPASTCTPSAPAITSRSAASASPHSQALTGHSDADVVLHALTDAILGALADGDIGVHFPPSDPQWRGASSDRFVAFALERLAKRGGRIGHIDINIVCEAPRIGPHRDAMRANIARLAGIDAGARGGEGDHQRKTWLHRPRRRHRRLCDRDGAAALECGMNADLRTRRPPLLDLARARGLKVATAESCTGGLVAGALTEIAGSSDVVDRGFVTYSNEAKQQMLGVPADTIRTHGAVSRETAEAMARGALGKAARTSSSPLPASPAPAAAAPTSRLAWCISPPPRATARLLTRRCATAISAAAKCGDYRCCRRWRCSRRWRKDERRLSQIDILTPPNPA